MSGSAVSSAGTYSRLDRLLHYVAFGAPFVQRALGELENDLFRRRFAEVTTEREVFVTGLPRAGTTLLLELLHETGEFATWSYRHMPFVLAPLLWARASRPFHKQAVSVARAHGDGMSISYDSPEAFEEVVWLAYLKDRIVRGDRLAPLAAGQETAEFAEAFQLTVRKLLAAAGTGTTLRYLSKNNANLSRIGVLRKLFPTATVVVPFRQPLAHVGSLMHQHARFRERHRRDRFSQRYMAWIGHYDFGANFRPIDFDGWLGEGAVPAQPDLDFWLRYWSAAYRHVLEQHEGDVCLVDFDRMLRGGGAGLEALAEHLGLARPEQLTRSAARLRAPTSQPPGAHGCTPAVLAAADALHRRLQALAL